MRAVYIPSGNTVLVLSRRNLESLLEQLNERGHGSLHKRNLDGTFTAAYAEENDEHYLKEGV